MSTDTTVSEREQRFKQLQKRIGDKGVALADKAESQALLEDLELAEKEGKLSGFEASQLPWLRNLVKRIIQQRPSDS